MPPGAGGMKVGVFRGVGRFGDGVLGGGGADNPAKGARGAGGRGEKNPGGGIPGGWAGKRTSGAGGKGGVKLGDGGMGTGAIENGVFEGRGGMVCGKRPASAAVSSTNPTEPGRFFEEFPP